MKVSQKGKGIAKREVTVEWLITRKREMFKLQDPENRVKDDMVGRIMDIAIVVPVATVKIDREIEDRTPYQSLPNPSVPRWLYLIVKEVHVQDVWHEPEKYAHLISFNVGNREMLADVDDYTFDEVVSGDAIRLWDPKYCILDIQDHFARTIEQNLGKIETLSKLVAEKPSWELDLKRYWALAHYSRETAVAYALSNDKTNGRRWFKTAAEYFNKVPGRLPDLISGMPNAVMSRDGAILEKLATEASGLKYKRTDIGVLFIAFIGNLVLGNLAEAEKIAAVFEEQERTSSPRAKRHYNGRGTMCLGIARRDGDLLKLGLNMALESHDRIAPYWGRIRDESLVSLETTALMMLAKDRGIDVKPEEVNEKHRNYILWALFD